jgi:hypothetical protein
MKMMMEYVYRVGLMCRAITLNILGQYLNARRLNILGWMGVEKFIQPTIALLKRPLTGDNSHFLLSNNNVKNN